MRAAAATVRIMARVRTVILAFNTDDARREARERNLAPGTWVYAHSSEVMRTAPSDAEVVHTNRFWHRRDAHLMDDVALLYFDV